jgi:hypothetical protein
MINSTLSYKMAFKVIDLIDSLYYIDAMYQLLDMKIKIADKIIEVDSRNNNRQDVTSRVFAAMMNKPFRITITKSGKASSINVEKMISDVFDSFPQIDEEKKQQIRNQFLKSLSGNAFKGNLEMQMAIFPEISVLKKDRWIVNTKLDNVVKTNIHTVYQLNNITSQYYQILGNGTITTTDDLGQSEINGLPVKYHITGTSLSDIRVDRMTGWIKEIKLQQSMKGDVYILDNPKVPGGLKFPMTIHTTVTTFDH